MGGGRAGRPRLPVPPPYWAWPWAGGQVLARYVLDHPGPGRGRRVADIGAGGGVVAIAAALAGAAEVTAVDLEPFAIEAARLNAAANGVTLVLQETDPIGSDDGWDVVLAGDLWYEPELAARMGPWLRALAGRGALVLTGDLGRAYLPVGGPHRARDLRGADPRRPRGHHDQDRARAAPHALRREAARRASGREVLEDVDQRRRRPPLPSMTRVGTIGANQDRTRSFGIRWWQLVGSSISQSIGREMTA